MLFVNHHGEEPSLWALASSVICSMAVSILPPSDDAADVTHATRRDPGTERKPARLKTKRRQRWSEGSTNSSDHDKLTAQELGNLNAGLFNHLTNQVLCHQPAMKIAFDTLPLGSCHGTPQTLDDLYGAENGLHNILDLIKKS